MTAADLRKNAPYIVAFLAIVGSLSGITNGFALDDVHLIVANDRLHHLSRAFGVFTQPYWPPEEGSSLYRPFTSLAFVLQWTVGGGSPLPFHIVSIALYAIVSVAVFQLAVLMVDLKVALIAASLFAVHPLHVEAVANVVGQAELWSALFAIAALICYIRDKSIVKACAFYWVALLFKEHVIVLPAIIAAYEMTGNRRIRDAVPALIAMSLVGIAFIVLRTIVIGELQGGGVSPLFAGEGLGARFYTMLRVSTEWMRLFFWPSTLSADYSPSQIPIATGFEAEMIPGLLVILSACVFAIHSRKNQPVISFALMSAAILLAIPSNLVVVTGFVLAERTLFLPSVMVVIGAAAVLKYTFDSIGIVSADRARAVRFTLAAFSLIVVAGIARSSTRNPVWRDNDTLFVNTVVDAPRSAKAHMMMAQLFSDRGNQKKAIEETIAALKVGSPKDSQLFAFAADMFQMAGDCKVASGLYARSLELRANQPQVRINASICESRLASLTK
jgi:hypothetical protein